MVNLVHTDGKEHYPIDYRIYAKEGDGKTKNDHFKEMLINAVADKQIKAKKVLFDSWYAAWDNLKLVNRLGLIFYTTLKNNHSLKAVLERINEAEGRSRELKTLSLPKLQTGFSYIHLSERPSLDLEAGVLTPQALSIEIADDNMYNFQLHINYIRL